MQKTRLMLVIPDIEKHLDALPGNIPALGQEVDPIALDAIKKLKRRPIWHWS